VLWKARSKFQKLTPLTYSSCSQEQQNSTISTYMMIMTQAWTCLPCQDTSQLQSMRHIGTTSTDADTLRLLRTSQAGKAP